MNNLNKNEWIGAIVAVCVVGLFFVFGPQVLALFTHTTAATMPKAGAPQVKIQDTLIGSGPTALAGEKVTVNYVGRFTNGVVFVSSVARKQTFTFVLGTGQVIPGWDQGLVGMKVGGKRTLVIPPELAYGAKDYGPIPGGSTLIFDVELLKVEK